MSGAIHQWMLGAAGLVVAAGVGRWTASPSPAAPPPATQATVERVVSASPVSARDWHDRAQVRAEIRAAVASAVVAGQRHEAEEAEAPTAVQLSAEAEQLVAGAIGRATWSEDDWRALDELTMRASPEESFEASRRVAVAVNSGQIKRVAPPIGSLQLE